MFLTERDVWFRIDPGAVQLILLALSRVVEAVVLFWRCWKKLAPIVGAFLNKRRWCDFREGLPRKPMGQSGRDFQEMLGSS